MIYGNWTFYIEVPKHQFKTTIKNSKRTYTKKQVVPVKKIREKFPEISFYRPARLSSNHEEHIFGVVENMSIFPFAYNEQLNKLRYGHYEQVRIYYTTRYD